MLLRVTAVAAFVGISLSGCGAPGVDPTDPVVCPFGGVTANQEFYQSHMKAFVGLNPRSGYGSGFLKTDPDYTDDSKFGDAPETNGHDPQGTTRNDMCTCDCKASDDGVGCTGWAGINFRYISHLAAAGEDGSCAQKEWSGQMVGQQWAGPNGDVSLEFLGEDRRASPGGATAYAVAGLLRTTSDGWAGVFKQANSPVSCKAGLADKLAAAAGDFSCFTRCANSDTYSAWIDYCEADTEDTSLGFSGWATKNEELVNTSLGFSG